MQNLMLKNPKGKEVGHVTDSGIYYTKRMYQKHFHRNIGGYGISTSIVKTLLRSEVKAARFIVRNKNALKQLIVYEIGLNDFISKSEKVKYQGHDEQYICPVERMRRIR